MYKSFNLEDFQEHFRNCIGAIKSTYPFIRKEKLWKGFLGNRWVVIVTVLISILFTYFLFDDITSWLSNHFIDTGDGASIGGMKEAGKEQAISSGTRYLLLIFLEVIIYHFSIKAVNALRGENNVPQFKDFAKAERRMILLMLLSWVKAGIVYLALLALANLFGFKFILPIIMFFVHAYFIGFAFFDNYNEQFSKTMRESMHIIRAHVGAAIALGIVISVLLYIPLVGPVLAPIFGSIAAAIYGHKYGVELTFGEEVFEDDVLEEKEMVELDILMERKEK